MKDATWTFPFLSSTGGRTNRFWGEAALSASLEGSRESLTFDHQLWVWQDLLEPRPKVGVAKLVPRDGKEKLGLNLGIIQTV